MQIVTHVIFLVIYLCFKVVNTSKNSVYFFHIIKIRRPSFICNKNALKVKIVLVYNQKQMPFHTKPSFIIRKASCCLTMFNFAETAK